MHRVQFYIPIDLDLLCISLQIYSTTQVNQHFIYSQLTFRCCICYRERLCTRIKAFCLLIIATIAALSYKLFAKIN